MKDYAAVIERLNQWAEYNYGGLSGGYRSAWPEKFYKTAPVNGARLTANGHETRAVYHDLPQEWPSQVIETDKAVAALLSYHGDRAPILHKIIKVEHFGGEKSIEARARSVPMGRSTYIKQRTLISAYQGQEHSQGNTIYAIAISTQCYSFSTFGNCHRLKSSLLPLTVEVGIERRN